MILVSFQGIQENQPFFKGMKIMTFDTHRRPSAVTPPYKCTQRHSSKGGLFSSEKKLRVT